MKVLKSASVLSLFALMLLVAPLKMAFADQWYAFCYGKLPTKTLCSPVIPRPLDVNNYCKSWAQSYGANMWGNHTATTIPILTAKQALKCQQIVGGGSAPATKNFQCYSEVLCPGPTGDTSSISLNPIGGSVLATDAVAAAKMCVSTYSSQYLNDLKTDAASGCYMQAKAQE